jgi:hypothetical protein
MKARNNFNSLIDSNFDDNFNSDDNSDFTPVKNKKKRQEVSAPIKPLFKQVEDSNPIPTKLTFENTPTKQDNIPVTNVLEAPRKNRRNLEALGESISQPNFEEPFNKKQNNRSNENSNRDMSGLEIEILKNENKFNQNKNNNSYQKNNNYHSQVEKPKAVPLPNINNSELFPTLAANISVEPKKVTVWNIFNPNVMISKEPEEKKTAEVRKIIEINKSMENNQNSEKIEFIIPNTYDSSDDEHHVVYHDNTDDSEDSNEMEEDSDVTHMRELYNKQEELEYKLEYMEKTYNKYNRYHVLLKHKLEDELFSVNEEIQYYDDIENELDKVYATSYYVEPSLYEMSRIRREKEEEAKREPERMKEFMRILSTIP